MPRSRVHWQLVNEPFGDPALYGSFVFERRGMLFDLGDLAPLTPRRLLALRDIFVSHAHIDHFAGFDRLLRVLIGREQRVALFGPEGFAARVGHRLAGYTWNLVSGYPALVFEVTEIGTAGPVRRVRFASRAAFAGEPAPLPELPAGVLFAEPGFRVRAAVLDHGTPSLAFAFEEDSHVNIWRNRLAERGLAPGPWLRALKEAVLAGRPDDWPVPLPGGALPLGALRDVFSVAPGQKIAYVVDAAYHAENARRISALAAGAELLFIETPFLAADGALAAARNHLTAAQAGALARQAGVKRIVPFHFSPRYKGREDALRAEAEAAFLGAGQG